MCERADRSPRGGLRHSVRIGDAGDVEPEHDAGSWGQAGSSTARRSSGYRRATSALGAVGARRLCRLGLARGVFNERDDAAGHESRRAYRLAGARHLNHLDYAATGAHFYPASRPGGNDLVGARPIVCRHDYFHAVAFHASSVLCRVAVTVAARERPGPNLPFSGRVDVGALVDGPPRFGLPQAKGSKMPRRAESACPAIRPRTVMLGRRGRPRHRTRPADEARDPA